MLQMGSCGEVFLLAKKGGKRLEETGMDWGGMAAAVVKGSVLALIITLAAALICAVLISCGWVELDGAMNAAPLLCVPGGAAGAVVSGRGQREWAMATGIGTGLGLFVLLAALGSGLCGMLPAGAAMPAVLAACVGSGGAVGLMGRGNRKKKRRKCL